MYGMNSITYDEYPQEIPQRQNSKLILLRYKADEYFLAQKIRAMGSGD